MLLLFSIFHFNKKKYIIQSVSKQWRTGSDAAPTERAPGVYHLYIQLNPCSSFINYSFQGPIDEGAIWTARMRRLVCTFVINLGVTSLYLGLD